MLQISTLISWLFVPVLGLLIARWGFRCLLYLIPKTQQNPNLRTDIFLERASYWSIVVGLGCTAVWLLAAIAVDSIAVLKGLQVLR